MKTSYQKVEEANKTYALIPVDRLGAYRKLRLEGGEKPGFVSWGDWLTIEIEGSPVNLKVCMLFAAGVLQKNVAKLTKLSESRVSLILSTSQARILVQRLYDQFGIYELREMAEETPGLKREHFWWGY